MLEDQFIGTINLARRHRALIHEGNLDKLFSTSDGDSSWT